MGQRARLWEKHRARSRKQQRGHSSTTPQDLQAGQSVTMKNAPMYQPGAVGKKIFLRINCICIILLTFGSLCPTLSLTIVGLEQWSH